MGDGPSKDEADKPSAFEELKQRRADEAASRQMYQMSGIGLEFVLSVAAFSALGWWLDKKFGTSPVWTLAGVALGFTLGLYRLVKFAKKSMR
jgi:F0F1-type ATP synthase assembly protein I